MDGKPSHRKIICGLKNIRIHVDVALVSLIFVCMSFPLQFAGQYSYVVSLMYPSLSLAGDRKILIFDSWF